jgi:hypothetical protein
MEGVIVQKLNVSRRLIILVGSLCGLLLVSGIWNMRQYQLIKQRHRGTEMAAQQARAAAVQTEAEAEAKRTKLKRKITDAERNARVSQLYEEINALTRMSEQVLLPSPSPWSSAAKTDGHEEVIRTQ